MNSSAQPGVFSILQRGQPLSFAPGQGGGPASPRSDPTQQDSIRSPIPTPNTRGTRSRGGSQVQGQPSREGGGRSRCGSEAGTSSLQELVRDLWPWPSSQQPGPEGQCPGPRERTPPPSSRQRRTGSLVCTYLSAPGGGNEGSN